MLDDIFAVQDDIARAVSSALHVTLLGKGRAAPKRDAKSYELLLRANHLVMQFNATSLASAVTLYQEVIAREPENARAWVGLSRSYLIQGGYGFADAATTTQGAREAAQRAMVLDDTLPEAHEVMAWILVHHDFAWVEAGKAFRRALTLAPGSSSCLTAMAFYEAIHERFDEAIALAQEAAEREPLFPFVHQDLGRILMWAGRHADARASMGRALELSPGMTWVHSALGISWVLEGKPESALAEIEREPSDGYRNCSLAVAYHALGRAQDSDAALRRLIESGPEWAVQVACTHAFRGEPDEAFAWLDRAYESRDAGIPVVKVQGLLSNLRSDPRWPLFLQKIGMSA